MRRVAAIVSIEATLAALRQAPHQRTSHNVRYNLATVYAIKICQYPLYRNRILYEFFSISIKFCHSRHSQIRTYVKCLTLNGLGSCNKLRSMLYCISFYASFTCFGFKHQRSLHIYYRYVSDNMVILYKGF